MWLAFLDRPALDRTVLKRTASLAAWLFRFKREEDGSELVEFALTVSLLLMMIFGIMDFSRAIYADHFVANAAREATRYAMVRGSSWKGTNCVSTQSFGCSASDANVAAYVQSITSNGIDVSTLTTVTRWPGTDVSGLPCGTSGTVNSPGCLVVVKVTYAFSFVLPFLPTDALSLSSTSRMTIAQ